MMQVRCSRVGIQRVSHPCSGVDPAECARCAGRNIEVFFRHYAKFLDDLREQANRLIEQSMNEGQRVSQGEALEG